MVVEVIINSNVKNLNRIFDYNVPNDMEKDIVIGRRVFVPFGRLKEAQEGFIIGIKDKSEYEIKDILKVLIDSPIDSEKIELSRLMARKYFCNISDCIKLMLPPGTTTTNFENRIKEKSARFVYLLKSEDEINEDIENKVLKSDKQIRILKFLIENDEVSTVDLETFTETTSANIKTLENKGYIEVLEKQVDRNPFSNKNIEKTYNLTLTNEQQEAFDEINEKIINNEFAEFLIFGVTGSGKTEIYLQLIGEVIKKNKVAIVLVPEISLTPQMVERFIARFGEEKIAVLHSKLSVGERFDQWKKIESGKVNIVIGARSAIFAPIKNLGLIIIDEEHDSSYKSDKSPRYNAKEIANFLAKRNNIPLVLGSATPDITTYYNALNDKINLISLTKRANNSKLPDVEIVDLKEELANGNRSMLSRRLFSAIESNLNRKKQTILFLNRRGYSTFVMCRDCGYTVKCNKCNVTMTYHSDDNRLKCHYCGYERKNVTVCPECGSKNIRYFGTGTEKLEAEIHKIFPSASTIRMDVDTVTKKNSHEMILDKFKNENIDILIGTQMVVKGHHFPNVTLVGVIAADSSLFIDDYRSNERTFQILTQVAGRAGREGDDGQVIIQTYNPENFAIECSKLQNYQMFYDEEIKFREMLKYPPFCDIIKIDINDTSINSVSKISMQIYQNLLKQNTENKMILYQPMPSPIDKIKNRYRWRIIGRCRFSNKIIDMVNNSIQGIKSKTARITIDINPNSMI